IGSNFIITVRHDRIEEIDEIRERFLKNPSPYRSNPAVILHSMMDGAVDAYFPLVEQITENIERETEQLISEPAAGGLERLLTLRHRNIAARRAVSSHRDITLKLLHRDLPAIREELAVYFVDILDHLGSLLLEIDNNAEFVSSALEIRQNAVSNKLNSTMKRLTTIATIFMPLTFITGIYGMNFEFMPELSWEYGYLATWLVMAAITVAMVIVAIKKDWF
ncbi:MAG: magnesium transporter CorA family protein, partial [Actinomycetota bacterium]|nr:magnesium transporter CorA family protein [Actinomycetota bacterium]